MEIKISKAEIFNEVEKRSSFEGSMIPERYDNVWANPDKGAILDSYWVEGYTAAVQLLKRYLTGSTIDYNLSQYNKDEVVTINATMPARYNSLLDGSVATDVKMMIACNILHGWLEVSNAEVAAKYDEESKGYAEDLRMKLLYRKDPQKTLVSAVSDADSMSVAEAKLSDAGTDAEAIGGNEAKLSGASADSDSIELSGAGLTTASTDEEAIEKGGIKLAEADEDEEEIEKGGIKLAAGKDDQEELKSDEAKLSKGKSDDEEICNHDFGMKYPSEDEVELKQSWGKCCYYNR